MRLATIGFTQSSAERFFERLRQARVARLIDIRLHNMSQMAGFTKRTDLPYLLKQICDVDYLHRPMLAPTPRLLLSYRQKKIEWPEFEREFVRLIKRRRIEASVSEELINRAVLLCSEASPEHCHRRLVAEYLQTQFANLQIIHL